MLEFMLPILTPEKPKRLTLTMANTLFGALSGVRLVKWGLLIHELVNRSISSIEKKPSYLCPYILHLYQHYGCTTREEDDAITIANEEIHFQVQPMPPDTSTESDEELPEAQFSPSRSPPPAARTRTYPPPLFPYHHPHPPSAAGTSRQQVPAPWQNVDLSTWEFSDNPFQRVFDDLTELQMQ